MNYDPRRTKFEASGVSKRHIDFNLDMNNSEQWETQYEKVRNIVNNRGLSALLGNRGTGKTQASTCAVGHVIYNLELNGMYTKAFDVFLSIRNANHKNSTTTEKEEIEKYMLPYLLVVDAFEVRGDTEFENRTLNHIIDRRYDSMKPTIIISNESVESFTTAIGESMIDRMKEQGGLIVFKGDSFRD